MVMVKNGVVKQPPQGPFPDRFKPGEFKQTVLISMADGSEETIWFNRGYMTEEMVKNDKLSE